MGFGACSAALLIAAVGVKARTSEGAGRKEIEAFNNRYVELHLKMDTAGVLVPWAGEGGGVIPGGAARLGEEKIGGGGVNNLGQKAGYKKTVQEEGDPPIHECRL